MQTNTIIKNEGEKLLKAFEDAAINYGWAIDEASGKVRDDYKRLYLHTRQNLIDYIQLLEEDI